MTECGEFVLVLTEVMKKSKQNKKMRGGKSEKKISFCLEEDRSVHQYRF
jgi:hypothetical protein